MMIKVTQMERNGDQDEYTISFSDLVGTVNLMWDSFGDLMWDTRYTIIIPLHLHNIDRILRSSCRQEKKSI